MKYLPQAQIGVEAVSQVDPPRPPRDPLVLGLAITSVTLSILMFFGVTFGNWSRSK